MGYDDTYAVYTLAAASNQLGFTFTPGAARAVKNPIFRIRGYTSTRVPALAVGGNPVSVNSGAADSGAFASLDAGANELWITLNRTVTAATAVTIVAP